MAKEKKKVTKVKKVKKVKKKKKVDPILEMIKRETDISKFK